MKEINGAPGYFIARNGQVFSDIIFGRWQISRREITQILDREGYQKVRLSISGKRRCFSVHRLVAEAYLPKPINAVMVRHLDDVKSNNHVDNLAWGTAADNAADAIRNGRTMKGRKRNFDSSGENNPNRKLTHEQVLEIRRRWDERVTLASLGREYGVEYPTIASIVKGKLWSRLVRGLSKQGEK